MGHSLIRDFDSTDYPADLPGEHRGTDLNWALSERAIPSHVAHTLTSITANRMRVEVVHKSVSSSFRSHIH